MAPIALAIDTSGGKSSVAVRDGKGAISESQSKSRDSHNEGLGSLVSSVLADAGLVLSDLELLVVGAGPGSFTGLRIGYGYVKGLAYALKLPVQQISSLAGMAKPNITEGTLIVACSDARREQLFTEGYLGHDQVWPSEIMTQSELSAKIAELSPDPADVTVVCEEDCPEIAGFHRSTEVRTAYGLILLSAESPVVGEPSELSEITPNYLRSVSAKTIKERENKGVGGVDL